VAAELNGVQEYLGRMHAMRQGDVEVARERQARRRRLALEQQAASEATEQKSKLDALLESLYKQSAEEARVAARLEQVKQEEAVLERNREQRLAQYRERRERDWAEALARETQLVHALKARAAAPFACCSFMTPECKWSLRSPRHGGENDGCLLGALAGVH
jgi:hypothetical protein